MRFLYHVVLDKHKFLIAKLYYSPISSNDKYELNIFIFSIFLSFYHFILYN